MSRTNPPLFVVLSTESMDLSQVEKINDLTRELAQALQSDPNAVASVTFGQKSDLPQGTKVAGELIFAQQMLLTVAPLMIPWVLGKIDAIIKAFAARGERVKAKVIVGNNEVKITPQTTSYELNKSAQQVKAVSELVPNKRHALVIGNSKYLDERLSDLNSSIVDAERFAELLLDPSIGSFDQVKTVINKSNAEVKQEIEGFFGNKQREDLLLLYYSGHGIKSSSGQLFLTAQDTSSSFLKATGISATFIRENMGESASQRQVLVLDCCYGGAIVEGMKSDNFVGQTVDTILSFQPSGFGKIIITASESMQYAFDGQHVEGQSQNSAFTKHLIEGLGSGAADTDNDGLVDIDELYQYIYRKVSPQQTPNMSSTGQEGRMFIGLNPNPPLPSASLPDHLHEAMQSENRLHRQGAVSELIRLLKSEDPSSIMAAEIALQKMLGDDSRLVSDLAREALEQHRRRIAHAPILEPQSEPALPKSAEVGEVVPPRGRSRPDARQPRIPVPEKPQPQRTPWGTTAVGLLNAILPGFAYARADQWGPAFLTFVIASILMVSLIFFSLALVAYVCTIPLMMAMEVFLFIQGRNLALKYNL